MARFSKFAPLLSLSKRLTEDISTSSLYLISSAEHILMHSALSKI